METINLTAPKGANYLKDWMKEIPTNCVLSKGITGCGATTVAIEQKGHTIIAMPFVGLIENKTEQYPETLLGIFGKGDKIEQIKDYADSHDTLKILTTFDSLAKVTAVLDGLGYEPYKNIRLIVDEWHVLFNSYEYRYRGIRSLLNTAKQYDNVTYISATPIERKYYLDEIKDFPEYRIDWPNAKSTNIRTHKVDKPLEYISAICKTRVSKSEGENYHIFINSVEDIGKIINTAKLTPNNTRVICSSNEDSLKLNTVKLGGEFTVSKALDSLKTISFYTSTCFEGQDILDKNGRTFIVSNARKEHTLLDISTAFIQICGRIRDSKYNDEIIHFYSTTKYNPDVTLEEFEQATEKLIGEAEDFVGSFNELSDKCRVKLLPQIPYINVPYIRAEDDILKVDRNLANLEIINYKIVNNIYQSKTNIMSEFANNNLTVTDDTSYIAPNGIKLIENKKMSFKDMFNVYCELIDKQPIYSMVRDFRLEYIEDVKPLIKEAYDKLGKETVIGMKYHQSNIKRELIKQNSRANDYKIVELINEILPHHKAIPVSKVKMELQGIYNLLGIAKRKAKATDINDWYETQSVNRLINGKSTACLVIVRDRFVRVG